MMMLHPLDSLESWFRVPGHLGFVPPTDIAVGEQDMVLTMDLPGFTAGDVELEVLGRDLIVRGERKRPAPAEGWSWALSERRFGSFERRIRLPWAVEVDAITANMSDGVLSLIVPKPEQFKPRKIEIAGAQQPRLETAAA